MNLRFIRKGVKDFFLKSKPRDKTSKNSHPNWLKNKILSGKAEEDGRDLILKILVVVSSNKNHRICSS